MESNNLILFIKNKLLKKTYKFKVYKKFNRHI